MTLHLYLLIDSYEITEDQASHNPVKQSGYKRHHTDSAGRGWRLSGMEWSKREREIARQVFKAAYLRECMAAMEVVRNMVALIDEPTGLWQLSDYLTNKRREIGEKYDYHYSVLPIVFARLIVEGWMEYEDLEGISGEKLELIRQFTGDKPR